MPPRAGWAGPETILRRAAAEDKSLARPPPGSRLYARRLWPDAVFRAIFEGGSLDRLEEMMAALVRFLAAAGALAFAAGLAAQETERPPDILVTGQDVDRQVRDFVGALTEAPPRGQLSRFERRVCPAAVGLSPTQKAAVAERLRRVAEAAGLDVAGASCTPNVLLIVTGDKRAFIESLEREYPYYFGDMTSAAVRRLARSPGPAAAWQIQGPPLDAEGLEMPRAPGGASGADYYVNRTTRTGSRITAAARPRFQAAAVVVEQRSLDGLTTTQLADYAAMRAFARTDPERLPASSPATILKILEAPMGSEVPLSLTPWDLSFLKALYAGTGKLFAASQRSEIRERVAKDMKAQGEPRP
jgi:hypothetical protein